MNLLRQFSLLICLLISTAIYSQTINSSTSPQKWSAFWITTPDAPAKNYGVYYFRKKISLSEKPGNFVVHVSGDNRYALMVNEKNWFLMALQGMI